jgi:hypothetical protein
MSPATHQTIRLSRGKHASPDEGACVMELASMLAGEPFSDHPVCVCPVIGSFLRAYNDTIDGERRQDLYEYAARVVGSRAPKDVQDARARRVADWSLSLIPHRWARFFLAQRLTALGREADIDAGAHAVNALANRMHKRHRDVLALIDELLAIGGTDPEILAGYASRAATRSEVMSAITAPRRAPARTSLG